MPDSKPEPPPLDSTTDVELATILDRYLEDRRSGAALDRHEFLAQYPHLADRLAACLDGIELMGDGAAGTPMRDLRTQEPSMPEVIGDYEILSELGRGGMGVVYAARERKLDRIVALKVMRFGIVDPRALERFQREAETAGALHHTNIVPVYATGRQADTSWYAMQRIDGDSLARHIDMAYRGESPKPISVSQILDVGIQAAEALGHAHDRDVVHRDVKPANLIVDREDRVWLTDFGLARRLVDVGATMTGAMMGTPRYMSPEQADLSRDDVDHRSDIYSLGATLYELATGRPPFGGDDPLSVMSQIRYDDPPPIRSLRSDLPRDLEVVLSKSMHKDPARRYATAAELADDLRAIQDDRPIQARSITTIERLGRWTRKHQQGVRLSGAVAVTTVAMIAVAGLVWQTWHESTLGTFRLRAAGGPYLTRVHRAGEPKSEASVIEMTVPTQHHQSLPKGDYDLMLAPRGRWSQQIRMPVTGGMPTEFRLRGDAEESKSIPIDDAWVSIVAPMAVSADEPPALAAGNSVSVKPATNNVNSGPAVLWRHDGELRRYTPDGVADWTLDVRALSARRTSLQANVSPESEEAISINFADTQSSTIHSPSRPRGNAMLDHDPMVSVPVTALRTKIDLNDDGQSDSVIAALDRPAIAAIDSAGKVLWARAYDLNGTSLDPPVKNLASADGKLPNVVDLIDIGDCDEDGTPDLLASLVHIQPGVANDLCVAVLSGKSGDVIRVLHRETLKTTVAPNWPSDGVLHTYDSNKRQANGLIFSAEGTRRVQSSRIFRDDVRWKNTSSPTYALPSPIQVTQNAGKRVAVYLIGDRCLRFDIDSGKPIGSAIMLPFMPSLQPTIAHSAGKAVMLFSNFDSGQTSIGTLALDIDGNRLWQRPLIERIRSESLGMRNRPNWPLPGDVDGDGNDELLVPAGEGGNGGLKVPTGIVFRHYGVQILDAWTGKVAHHAEFGSEQFQQCAEFYLTRMALSADINGDGFRDWVTASISGPPQLTGNNRVVNVGEAYLYVDWISGCDGSSLSWARHRVPIVSDKISVAEIEAICCDIPDSQSGAVEVELITGDSQLDDELDSMVLRFHPSHSEPTAIASGLTVAGQATGLHRVYQMRPGPYADGPNQLIFLSEPDAGELRIGEQETVATWKDSVGRSLLALKGFEPPQLSVIDTASLSTLWTTARTPSHVAKFANHTKSDGRIDFLMQPGFKPNEPPQMLDGETGIVRWTMSAPPGGNLKVVNRVTDDWLIVVADGNYQRERGSNQKPPGSFQMSMVSVRSGDVRWAKEFLDGATRNNHPQNFDDLQYADLNGDGFPDVIGPEQGSDQQLMLAAWNGLTGEKMWQRPFGEKGSRTDYVIEFCVLPGETPWVAYYGMSNEGKRNFPALIVCNGETGDILIKHDFRESITRQIPDRDYRQKSLRLANCTTDPNQPTIGVLGMRSDSPNCKWLLLEVHSDGLIERDVSGSVRSGRRNVNSLWTHDIDGDGVSERFISERLRGAQGLDKHGHFYKHEPRTTFACYQANSNEPKWEVAFDDPVGRYVQIRDVFWTQHDDRPVAWLELDRRFVLVDLLAGQIVGEVTSQLLPRVVELHRRSTETNQFRAKVAIPTADGMLLGWLGEDQPSFSLAQAHKQQDPRLIRPLLAVGTPETTSEILSSAVKSLVSAIFLVILPLSYIGAMIRQRRWSLSWLLLAPPVVMFALLVGSSNWFRQPSIYWNMMGGVGMISGFAAIYIAMTQRKRTDVFWGFSWAVIAGIAFLIAAFVALSSILEANLAPEIHHVITTPRLIALIVGSIFSACHCYWVARFVRSVAFRKSAT